LSAVVERDIVASLDKAIGARENEPARIPKQGWEIDACYLAVKPPSP
jgi:hypothetical protein